MATKRKRVRRAQLPPSRRSTAKKARATKIKRPKRVPRLTLTRIKLDGFKAVKSSGYVELKPLTLLIGRNGSGKSSLVEALQWMQDAYFDGLLEATGRRFRAYSYLLNKRSTTTTLHLEFQSSGKPVYYDLNVGGAAGSFDRPIVRDESLFWGRTNAQKTILSTTKGSKGPVYRNVEGMNPERNADRLGIASMSDGHVSLQSIARFVERMVVLRLSPTMMRFESRLERAAGRMLDEEGAQLPALIASFDDSQRAWVRERVSAVLSGIKNVKITKTDRARGYVTATERMKWRGGGRQVDLPSWMLSEGTRRITALFALLAANPRPSLLVIEEIENGLDPWTLEYVFQALREASSEGTQVIITTHSPFLLDHVNIDEVIHVRREEGDSTYRAISTYADVAKFGDAVAPGGMYIAGYFGGDES
ncbi:AAA family ATPase [Myxococcus sp. CA040A]|uniref:AAA family ATPase n=1 Tax=Myxococcus sp. CA040A TaxID=2741738 RepID=UPI00157BAD11|nr:ATP-binding protein [Myxococcus sp. CA040A]NTX06243.1 ATP-binding protein [Myxococcus sp. CA040A]